jgi:tRNA-uridine 2-sulfurtransferase
MSKKEKIVVAMSGGVDSSVAAALLVEQGYDVIGVTLQIWQESSHDTHGAGCCSLGAVEDARRVATTLDIPFYVLNYQQPFKAAVIDRFVADYKRGRTPNPCINCNRYIKFDALLEKALSLGAEKLATGHYAREFYDDATARWGLKSADATSKDQTYVLYHSTQPELAHMTMPVGLLPSKAETRELARKYGLNVVASKPDSQEICFVQNGSYVDFLSEEAPETIAPGKIMDSSGKVRGDHDGIAFYTIGQRKRINVGAGIPLYVLNVDPATQTVTVGADEELLAPGCRIDDINWVSLAPQSEGYAFACEVKIRYNAPAVPATVTVESSGEAVIHFDDPQRAIAPGQAAVFYGTGEQSGWLLGGGTIIERL